MSVKRERWKPKYKTLNCASEYHRLTGKRAANGATGKNITNQGGPFVKFAARQLGNCASQRDQCPGTLHRGGKVAGEF